MTDCLYVQESVDQGTTVRPGPAGTGYYRVPAAGPAVYSPPQQVAEPWPRRGLWMNSAGGNGPTMGIRSIETYADYTIIETVEGIKRPGQSLGFYIREGNGVDRLDGVFISRIAPGSLVERNGLLRVGEEIVAVDSVDITRMSLDDVVILMSIPRRLVLTVRTRKSCCSKNLSCPALLTPTSGQPVLPQPAVQRAEDAVREEVGVTTARRREHQRHWSTASVVDLTDNYADEDVTRSTLHRRTEPQPKPQPPRVGAEPPGQDVRSLRTDRWPGYFDLATAAHPDTQRLLTAVPRMTVTGGPVVTRSWDRRAPAASGEMVSAGGARRSTRYHVDYSSDTDAQFVDEQLPQQWRQRPPQRQPPTTQTPCDVPFEPEWPPTINGKRRRPAGAAPPRIDQDLHGGKRFNSDSDLNGFDKLFGTPGDAELVGDAVTAGELVRPGDRCNSLPDIDNGVAGTGDELRHWLRKLDKLSSELQEFNNRAPPAGI